jgi:hypothetical protein
MYVKAELKCLNRGRTLGEATGDLSRPLSAATLSCPSGMLCFSTERGSHFRCLLCGGRAIVDSLETLVPQRLAQRGDSRHDPGRRT